MRIDVDAEMRLSDLAERFESVGATLDGLKIVTEGDERHLAARLMLPAGLTGDRVADEISNVPGVTSVDWHP
jgi:hypothetical protein